MVLSMSLRRVSVAAMTAVAVLAFAAAPAFGHAVVSPPVVESGALQVFTLSVPTEREDRLTTGIELTVPKGFAIDSFAPARGWKRNVASTGSGETAVVTTVTWTGGSVPTGEDAVFQFNATASTSQTYTFKVRQTYDDEAVVDWSGDEGSDTPAPRIEAKASLGGGGSSTVAIVALMAGTLGILFGLVAILSVRGDRPLT
jgi:periplasmic copper chaperone A